MTVSKPARVTFPRCWFDADNCREGLEALRQYRAEFNEKTRAFSDKPKEGLGHAPGRRLPIPGHGLARAQATTAAQATGPRHPSHDARRSVQDDPEPAPAWASGFSKETRQCHRAMQAATSQQRRLRRQLAAQAAGLLPAMSAALSTAVCGFGGMSPGGYNSTTYSQNMAGNPNAPGFGAGGLRIKAARAKAKGAGITPGGAISLNPGAIAKLPVEPTVTTPPTEVLVDVVPPDEPIDAPLDPFIGAPPPVGTGLVNPYGPPKPPGAMSDMTQMQGIKWAYLPSLGMARVQGIGATVTGDPMGDQGPRSNTIRHKGQLRGWQCCCR